jgi:hypothetical protein
MVAIMTPQIPRWRYGILIVVATVTGVVAAGCSSGAPTASNSTTGTHTTFPGLNDSTKH